MDNSSERAGYRDYLRGIPKERNPFQYTSNIFKQAWWLTGWEKAERKATESMKNAVKDVEKSDRL